MFNILSRFRKLAFSRTTKDTSIILLGNSAASALAIAFTIIAARYLGPADWGIVAAVISFVVIVEAIGDLGLGSGLFKFVSSDWVNGKREKAVSTLSTIFLIRLVTATLLLVVLILASGILSKTILHVNQPLLIVFGALSVFAYLLLDFQITALQAKHSWGLAAFLTMFTNLFRIIFILFLLATNNISVVSILLAFTISPLVTFFISLFWNKADLRLRRDWAHAREKIVPFSGWLGINRISGSIISRLDVLLLLSFLGAYQTGIFAAAKQLAIGVPMIVGSLATVIAPRLAVLQKEALVVYFKKAILLSVLITIGLGVGIILTPYIVELFGDKYTSSTPVLQLLLFGYIPFVLSMPAVNLLIYSLGKPQVVAIIALFQLPALYLSYFLIIPSFGLLGAAVVNGIWHLTTMIFGYLFAWYYLGKQK